MLLKVQQDEQNIVTKIISIANNKGGVGKTTSAANLAFALGRRFKTLMIDLDPQCNLSVGLGFKNCPENIGSYIKDLIHYRQPQIHPLKINNYVEIIPGDPDLLKIENLMHENANGEFMMRQIISYIKQDYDIIIIDCPPVMNSLCINALNACNLLLIPAKPELFSLQGVETIERFLASRNLPFKIFFNQVNTRSTHHKKLMKEIESKYTTFTLHSYVRNNVALSEAFSEATSIFHYKTESIGAKDFVSLSDEITQYI